MENKIEILENLCIDIIDCPHSTPKWLNSGIPVIRNFNIKNGFLDLKESYFVDEETYLARTKRAIPNYQDLIISREAPMGEVCLIPENFKCCLGQRLVLLKVNKTICNPYYLLYALQSDYVQKQIKKIDQTGSIVSNLNISDLKQLKIPFFDMPIQEKIANTLKLIDAKIEILEQINDKITNLLENIYNYWFIQYDFPNINNKPYSANNELIFNEKYNKKIPMDWDIISIKELCDIVKGDEPGSENYNTKKVENSIPFIRVSDLENNNPVYVSETFNGKKCTKDNILISLDGSVGKVKYGFDGFYSSGIRKITAKNNKCNNAFIYMYFRSEEIQKLILKYSTGSVLKHASASIDNMYVAYNKDVFDRFTKMTDVYFQKLLNNQDEINKFKELKNKFLPILINGQLLS